MGDHAGTLGRCSRCDTGTKPNSVRAECEPESHLGVPVVTWGVLISLATLVCGCCTCCFPPSAFGSQRPPFCLLLLDSKLSTGSRKHYLIQSYYFHCGSDNNSQGERLFHSRRQPHSNYCQDC